MSKLKSSDETGPTTESRVIDTKDDIKEGINKAQDLWDDCLGRDVIDTFMRIKFILKGLNNTPDSTDKNRQIKALSIMAIELRAQVKEALDSKDNFDLECALDEVCKDLKINFMN